MKKKNDDARHGITFLERYALWSHRNPLLALTCIVLVAVACILTVALNDELKFVETNDREWVILKDEITSDADAASEGTRLVEECVSLLHAFRFLFVYSSYLFLHIDLSSPLFVFNELLRFREEKNRRTDIFFYDGRSHTFSKRDDRYSSSDVVYERGEESQRGSLFFQFVSNDESETVFTKANLLAMREIHRLVVTHPKYKQYCHLKDPKVMNSDITDDVENIYSNSSVSYLDVCVKPLTPVSVFFPPNGEGELVEDIDEVVRIIGSEENKKLYGYFLDGAFDVNTLVNGATRARYPMGAPIIGYNSLEDREREQGVVIGEAILDDIEKELFDRYSMKAKFLSTPYMSKAIDNKAYEEAGGERANMQTRWYAGYLRSKDAANVINFDLAWAFASILAVWCYMAFHTRSFFIASLGMFEIICSFPVALFIYKLIYRIEYLGNVQILSIFVVLGVGADDVFVFYDAYKQSQFEPRETVSGSTLTRVLYTSRRASKAIFVTSFTTMGAFFATSLSEVMPISAFGILSATMIAVLFVVNVLMFPPALFLYSLYLDKFKVCCFCTKANYKRTERYDLETATTTLSMASLGDVVVNEENNDIETSQEGTSKKMEAAPNAGVEDNASSNTPRPMDTLDSEANIKRLRPIERFFRNQFYTFISYRPVCYIVIAGFLSLLSVSLKLALELETPAQQEQWYPTAHLMQAYANDRTRFSVSADDRVVPLDVCFGVRGMDTSKTNHWDIDQVGKLQVDETFDITPPASQLHLLNACRALRIAPCDVSGCQDGLLVMSRPVISSSDDDSTAGVEEDATQTSLNEQRASGVSCFMESFEAYVKDERNLTFPIDDKTTFLKELWNFRADSRFYVFKHSIGFLPYDETKPIVPGENELDIFFVKITVQTTLKYPTTAKVARPVFRVWEAWVKTLNEEAPPGMQNAIQTAYNSWTWMVTQEALVRNTFQGVTICFVMAYLVLVLSTMNFLTGAIATVTIAGVVVTVMGLGVRGVMRWDLGIGESIAAVILIGLSVDYCVHLANAYTEAPKLFAKTRGEKTRRALMIMGVSVTASAMTTVISGSMLWLCVLKFFSKFAFLITVTITSSYLWSILFLPAALICFGPEGDRWSLEPAVKKLKECWSRRVKGGEHVQAMAA